MGKARRKSRKLEPRYAVNVSLKAWDIAKAGAGIELTVSGRNGLLGTIEIGQGMFGWRNAHAWRFRRFTWAQLADKLDQL
jgi:hypothetical protein